LVVSYPNYHSLQNYAVLGVASLGGGPATPKIPNSFFRFFFLVAFRGGRTTTKGMGWLRPPHMANMGWPKPPLGQKWGGPATPFLGKGWLEPPRDFPPFFKKNFLLFKKKKKKLKPKMPKTMPFWAKWRSFGVNGSLDKLLPKGS
jgi:hypothetical protein